MSTVQSFFSPEKTRAVVRWSRARPAAFGLDGRGQAISVAAELYLCIDLSLRVEHLAAVGNTERVPAAPADSVV